MTRGVNHLLHLRLSARCLASPALPGPTGTPKRPQLQVGSPGEGGGGHRDTRRRARSAGG